MCQHMGSKMLESDRSVIAALFDIMDDDVDNTKSEAVELCVVMERLLMLCEIDSVSINALGVISEVTNVVEPLASMLLMPSTSTRESK
jgi:hypothetical protein